jgi:hypothetical protein
MSSFIRPTGVHRDINELEYISALLQSNQHVLRTSGTIIATDIAVYLKSRHGLIVSEDVIDRLILTELAGQIQDEPIKETLHTEPKKKKKLKNTDESEEPDVHFAMDISQITAILLIPELIEASESRDMKIFAPFRDVITAHMKDGQITGPILREIFASVNEYIVSDTVITEMLELANRPESLIQALVSDVVLTCQRLRNWSKRYRIQATMIYSSNRSIPPPSLIHRPIHSDVHRLACNYGPRVLRHTLPTCRRMENGLPPNVIRRVVRSVVVSPPVSPHGFPSFYKLWHSACRTYYLVVLVMPTTQRCIAFLHF